MIVLTRGVSGFGGALTAFGLDVWIFDRTGSYSTFAYLALLTFLPNLVLAPFTGMVVDRCNKKWLLLACELCSLATIGLAFAALRSHALGAGVAAVVILSQAIIGHVRWTAMSVAISLLTPTSARSGVNGLQQAVQGVTDIGAPMLGAFALQMVGFGGILTLALLGCMIGIAGMSTVAADVLHVAPFPTSERRGFWYEATFGFRWIWREPDLSRLLIFIMGYNLVSSVYAVTFTPYLLSWTPVHTLGVAAGLEGGAAVLAGFSLAYFGDRVRAEARVICAAALFGLVLTVWGLARASGTLCGLALCAGTLTSLIVASLQSVWQSNTPIDIQGKVFAARRMVSYLLIPVAVLASVPLSRSVFAPWLRSDPFVTSIWGAGQGGALGMMLSALGICLVAGCAWYASQRRLLRFRAPIVVPE